MKAFEPHEPFAMRMLKQQSYVMIIQCNIYIYFFILKNRQGFILSFDIMSCTTDLMDKRAAKRPHSWYLCAWICRAVVRVFRTGLLVFNIWNIFSERAVTVTCPPGEGWNKAALNGWGEEDAISHALGQLLHCTRLIQCELYIWQCETLCLVWQR